MSTSSDPIQCPLLILSITGELYLGFENEEKVRDMLNAVVVQSEARHVVLDMKEIQGLQSAGFRPLLSLRRLVKGEHNGRVFLCCLHPDVKEILEMTRMIHDGDDQAPFENAEDVPSAVAKLYQNGNPS